tara:strand:+ start:751 stop:945 length:195 start_codon:yes stop_codon:yes gene_type:complete
MKGNISKSIEGALSSVRKKGSKTLLSLFLKKEISSKILKIITSVRKIIEIIKIFFKNNLIKYPW